MLARPATLIAVSLFCSSISFNIVADPIGSLKSIKKFKNIPIKEAPNPTSNISSNPQLMPDKELDAKIARSQFTTAIVNREPTDDVVMLSSNSNKIYYFTELTNLKGHNVTHRWLYDGKLMAEITFDVKSDRWRVFSSKKIRPDWTGEWSVELVDENGKSLQTGKLEIVAANN